MNSVTFPRPLSPITEEDDCDHAIFKDDDDKETAGDRKISPLEPTNNSAINTAEEADLSYNSNSNEISKASEFKSNNSFRKSTNTTQNLNYVQKQIYFNNKLRDLPTMAEEQMLQFEVGNKVTNVPFNLPEQFPSLDETSKDNTLKSEANAADATVQTSDLSRKNYSTGDLVNLLLQSSNGVVLTYPTNLGAPFSCSSPQTEIETPDRATAESLTQIGKVCQFGNDTVFVGPSRKRLLDFIDDLSRKSEVSPVLNQRPHIVLETTPPRKPLEEIEEESDDIGSASSAECDEVTNMYNINGADDVEENGSETVMLEREKEINTKFIRRNQYVTHHNPRYWEEGGLSQNVDSVLMGVNNSVTTKSWKHNLGEGSSWCGPQNKVAFQRHTRHVLSNKIYDEAKNFIQEIVERVAEILSYQTTGTNTRGDHLKSSSSTIGGQMNATKPSVRDARVSSFRSSKDSETVKEDVSSSTESNNDKKAPQQEPNKAKLKSKKTKNKTPVKGGNKEPFIQNKFKSSLDPAILTKVIFGQEDPNKCNDASLESKSATVCKSCKSADSTTLILNRIKSSFDLCGWSVPMESQDIPLCLTEMLHPFESKGRTKGKIQDSSSMCDESGQKVIVKGTVITNKIDRKKHKKEQNQVRRFTKKSRNNDKIGLERENRKSKDAFFKLKNIYGYGERCGNSTLGEHSSFVTFLKAKAIQSTQTTKASQSTKTRSKICTSSSEILKRFSFGKHCRQKLQHYELPEPTYILNKLNEICDSSLYKKVLKHKRSDICTDRQIWLDLQLGSNMYLHEKLAMQLGPQGKDQLALPRVTNVCNPWTPAAIPGCDIDVNSNLSEPTSPVEAIKDDANESFRLLSGTSFNSTQQNATVKPSKNQSNFLPSITNHVANTLVCCKEGREQLKLPPVHSAGSKDEKSGLSLMKQQPLLSVTSFKAALVNEKEINSRFRPPKGDNQEEEINNKRHPSKCYNHMMSKPVKMNIHLSPLTHWNNKGDLIVTAKSFPKLDAIQLHDIKSGSAHSEPQNQCAEKQRHRTKDKKSHQFIKRCQSPKWHQYASSQVLYLSKAPLSDTHGMVEPLADDTTGLAIRGLYPSLNNIQNEHEMKSNEMNQMGRSSTKNIPLERTKKQIRQTRWSFSRFLSETSNNSLDDREDSIAPLFGKHLKNLSKSEDHLGPNYIQYCKVNARMRMGKPTGTDNMSHWSDSSLSVLKNDIFLLKLASNLPVSGRRLGKETSRY